MWRNIFQRRSKEKDLMFLHQESIRCISVQLLRRSGDRINERRETGKKHLGVEKESKPEESQGGAGGVIGKNVKVHFKYLLLKGKKKGGTTFTARREKDRMGVGGQDWRG